jgi:hypothetical protein
MHFLFGNDPTPVVLTASYFGGTEETSFAHTVNGTTRVLSFRKDVAHNPHSSLINFIDEGTENGALMYKYFKDGHIPGLMKFQQKQLPVLCLGENCRICSYNIIFYISVSK